MPRPAILPQIDWPRIFESGLAFETWLESDDDPENAGKVADMRRDAESFEVPAGVGQKLRELPRRVHVLAIAECWCGDVVRHVPVLRALERASDGKIAVRFIAREQHPEVFVRFLTNGGEAIPKFVFLSEDYVETGNWGPMPERERKVIARGKAAGDLKAAREIVNDLYNGDADRRRVVDELVESADIAAAEQPALV